MHAQSEEAYLNGEEECMLKLLTISQEDCQQLTHNLTCLGCGKPRNQSKRRDFKRWSSNGDEINNCFASWSNKPSCDCKNEAETQGKSFKLKKRQSSIENQKVTRNQSTSVKDFIAHNKSLCNGARSKLNTADYSITQFVHHKNNRNHIGSYRRNKLKKLEEQTSLELDQSYFDNELFSSLSKSLSSIITEKTDEPQYSFISHVDSIGHQIQSRLKLNNQKSTSPNNSGLQNDVNFAAQQRLKYLSSLDVCGRSSDSVKTKEVSRQMSNGAYQESSNLLMRSSSQEKPDEKKIRKQTKRISDQRPKLSGETNILPLQLQATRSMIELAESTGLQPVCHQIPIHHTMFTEKNTLLPKKDEWKGHPTSVNPTFSEKPGRCQDGRRKQDCGFGKTLEYTDVFNCYGDKYNILKEKI
eukprot:gene15642-17221_t